MLAACATTVPSPTQAPTAHPAVECQPAPLTTVIDASGTPAAVPVRLTCRAAISAVSTALGETAADVTTYEFRYGEYCPVDALCKPPDPDTGFVIVTLANGHSEVGFVALDSGDVVVKRVERLFGLAGDEQQP